MKNYRDLEIFNMSYELAVRVHRVSLKLPKYELYEEGSQARRSSKGITSCIVEGYGRKRYKAEFVKYLVYAHASCDETLIHLQFIRDTHDDIDSEEIQDMCKTYDALGAKINKFIQYVEEEWR
jgi:four helix bundle protein